MEVAMKQNEVSFYLAGVRIGDLLRLKWCDFKNGRLYYTMGINNKPGSIKVNPRVQVILSYYKADKTLSGTNKNMLNHIARHSLLYNNCFTIFF